MGNVKVFVHRHSDLTPGNDNHTSHEIRSNLLTSWIDSMNRYVKQYLLFATLSLSFSIRRSHLFGLVSSCKIPMWKSLNSPQNFALSTVSAVSNSFFLNMNVRWKIGINASNIQILVLLWWEYHWFQYLKHSLVLVEKFWWILHQNDWKVEWTLQCQWQFLKNF